MSKFDYFLCTYFFDNTHFFEFFPVISLRTKKMHPYDNNLDTNQTDLHRFEPISR